MIQEHDQSEPPTDVPDCDCGYRAQGISLENRIADARRHAHEAHGIDVSADQVLGNGARP